MIKYITYLLTSLFLLMSTNTVVAGETIVVTVKTKEKKAAAIGYSVDGRDYGTLGSSYTGKGPANKEYHFGYKTGIIFGENIDCGYLTLTENSTVILISQDNRCVSILN